MMYRRWRQMLHAWFAPPHSKNGRRQLGRIGVCSLMFAGVLLLFASIYGLWPLSSVSSHPSNQMLKKTYTSGVTTRIPARSSTSISVHMEKQFVYANLHWTVTQVVDVTQIGGMHIPAGMKSVEIMFRVDNTLAQEVILGSPYDYMSITAGTQIFAPLTVTLPVAFAADIRGEAGTVTFLVPQHASPCTLILSSSPTDGYYPAYVDLALPS